MLNIKRAKAVSSSILALQFVVHWFSVAFAIFSGQKKEEEGW